MKPEQQRIAIAEFCGWTYGNFNWFLHGENQDVVSCPDYLNDLNAMHEAEKLLNHEQRNTYINLLDGMPDDSDPVQHDFQWCCSPAPQRAEAFLRAIGKWEDEL